MGNPDDVPNTGNGDEFSELMKNYSVKAVDTKTPVEGRIIDFIDDGVIIDIGQKTEGILKKEELADWDGNVNYKVGDTISVMCKYVNMKEGYIIVSKKEVDETKGWESAQQAYDKGTPVTGKIIKVEDDNKGYIVDMGVNMFLPMSQVDIKKIKNPQQLLGKEYEFKIIKLNSRDKSGVLSRRILLEEERDEKVKQLFDTLQPGDLVKGVVSTITDYGAFVNIGGIDGLVMKENISYGRINHPREKLRRGDEIEAVILDLDKESGKISLGIKQKHPDPWLDVNKKFPVGHKMVAKVTKIVNFGAFIELEEGIEGLLHISDLTWEGKPESVEEYVAVGDKTWVQVIEVNAEERKIKLGLKQLEMRPEEKYIEKHQVGEIIKGTVKKVLKSRAFVELEPNVEGVIKISDISYFRIDSPKEFIKEGEEIDAMIISDELDSNYKVKLGLKQLSDGEWDTFFKSNPSGTLIKVKIKKISENGVSVEISKNIEGFIRLSEVDEKKLTEEEVSQMFKSGDEVEAEIQNTDPRRKRIYLSIRAIKKRKEREEIEKFSKSDNEPVTTIGDLLQTEIDKKK